MRLLAAMLPCLVLLQDTSGSTVAPPAPPWSESAVALVDRVNAGDWEAARDVLAAELRFEEQRTERERGELRYAAGLVLLLAELEGPTGVVAPAASAGAFVSARALAGPGRLRLEATYDAGVAWLETAERWRAHLPEVAQRAASQGLPAPTSLPLPQPPAAGAGAPSQEEGPDPLAEARAAYARAKELLVERLRADWRDADTRANLELIQRRLAELDEIERQREEQQQEQQREEQDQEDQEQDDQEQQDDQQEGEEGEEEQQDQESEGEQEEERSPEDQDEEQEQEQEQPEPESDPSEREPEGAGEDGGEGGEAHRADESEAERMLTREEVLRLLERLDELEEEREALEAALTRARRVPVEKDW